MTLKKLPYIGLDRWVKLDPLNLEELPALPCCYVIYMDRIPSYVGQTNNAKRRIANHRLEYCRYSSYIKTPWGEFREVSIKCKFPSKYGQWAMTELRLIRKIKPRFNQTHMHNGGVSNASV